jgi:hypothetical protein
LTFFNKPSLVGFNLVRTHTDNQDAAFHAVQGVTRASRATAFALRHHRTKLFYLPVIVVNSPIVRCHLPESSADVQLEEIQRGVLLHSWDSMEDDPPGRSSTRVHIVHIASLPDFVDDLKRDTKKFLELLNEFRE